MVAVTREVLDAIHDKRIPQADTELFATFRPWAKTSAELAAGVTPVNYAWPPGYVDRYGTNTTPGTTDMAPAFNAAFAVAAGTGCSVRWGATAPYRLNSPINCTGIRGVVAWDETSENLSAGISAGVIIAHTGHGFDMAASTELTFNNVVAMNLSGTVPASLFFMARNAAQSGAGIHRFNNIRTVFGSQFTTIIYNYGSEETNWNDCSFYNHRAGSSIATHTATNTSSYTSTFVTIATGAQSNVTHRYRGCTFFQFGNSGSVNESIFQLEGTSNFSCVEGSFYCPFGLAYVNYIGALAMIDIDFANMRGETDGVNSVRYGYFVQTTSTTGGNSHNGWTYKNCRSFSSNEFLRFVDTAEIVNLDMNVVSATSGQLLSVYNMTYSRILHGTSVITGRAGGTVSNVKFIGLKANVSLAGTASANVYDDLGLGQAAVDGVKFPATQVPSSNVNTLDDYEEGTWTPTLTLGSGSVTYTTQTGTYTKIGRLVTVQVNVVVNVATTPGGSLKASGLPFTSSATAKGSVSVFPNSLAATATTMISGIVDPAATTISLFKYAAGAQANLGGDVQNGSSFQITASYEV